ncbi:MAG: MerR family transcriptional regulator [Clostridia bacterium]|nr:MerR family transcriptional regulator [Clostridia bacterium]
MKIKAVCDKTGLTDRTIRYYIEEGLISPSFTENYLGRKSFDFSDDDISELCDISVLRNFDFSIEEIRQLLRSPESSLDIIKAVKERVGGELLMNQKKLSALSSLDDQTVYTVSELARELLRPDEITPTKDEPEANIWRRAALMIKEGGLFLAVWLPIVISACIILIEFIIYDHPIAAPIFLVVSLISTLPSILSIFSSRIRLFRNKAASRALFFVCLACIPISVFSSLSAVYECEHSWVTIAVEAEVSCAQEGRIVKQCDVCRDVVVEMQGKLPHTVVIDREVEASCSSEGLSVGEHCSVCQTVLVKQEVIPKKDHAYVKSYVEPTCDKEGYVLLTCACGYSCKDTVIPATERHDFKKNGNYGYICSYCSLEVCEHGYASRLNWGPIRYYITGRADSVNEQERTLVIYGSGEMPEPSYPSFHPWRTSIYVEEIKTVVICEGVTSIASGAFSGSMEGDDFFGNPFHSVESFIIKGTTLTVDPDSPDISGIECEITYER